MIPAKTALLATQLVKIMNQWDYQNFAEEFSVALDGPETAEFAGLYEATWDSGNVRYKGNFERNFCRVGIHQCFWESGTLREHGRWKNGFIVGTLQRFRPNGTLEMEYFFGELSETPWRYIERVYDDAESLIYVSQMKGFEEVNRWTSPDLLKHEGPDAPFSEQTDGFSEGGADLSTERGIYEEGTRDDTSTTRGRLID